jgi:hypothetical protein
LFDGFEEGGLDRTVRAPMVVECEFLFGLFKADDAVGDLSPGGRWRFSRRWVWREGQCPQSVGWATWPFDNDLVVFDDLYVVLGEKGYAVVVAQLSNGQERSGVEVVEDVRRLGLLGKLGG